MQVITPEFMVHVFADWECVALASHGVITGYRTVYLVDEYPEIAQRKLRRYRHNLERASVEGPYGDPSGGLGGAVPSPGGSGDI